ncbi:MAG: AMP-binding protein [Rhodobacteraceae bacterium]|nr:AMP-binding protein [Paracoccaceae bacterium]
MERVEDLLRHQVETRPEYPAFSDSTGLAWTYADLDRASLDLMARLEGAGVQTGDRVLILSENCCPKVAALFACYRMGAVAVPVNARQTRSEIERIQRHATPAAVLLTTSVSPDAQSHAEWFQAREISGRFGQMHLAETGVSDPDAPEEVAVLLYTTGTTGDPKGVMLTHGNLRFGGRTSAELRGMTPKDVIYGVLPTTHVFGLASVITAAVHVGAPVRLEARFTAAKLYEALRSGVTLLSAVPQMHALLMQYTKEQGFDRLQSDTLRYVSSGAAPLDPDWKARAEAFYGVAVQNGYGMTETTAGICATSYSIGVPDVSVGPPLPGVEVRLDEDVPGGGDGLGEVLARGANVMLGYYRNPDETAKVLEPEGWMRTGDMGRFDDQGLLHIEGRSKELIIHGGFNVFPPEVEAALNAHPQVVQAAVIGRRMKGDEEVLAFVQVADGDVPDAEELRAFVAGQLAGYKRPSHIVMAADLPAAPTGKILKHKLLEHFAERLDG